MTLGKSRRLLICMLAFLLFAGCGTGKTPAPAETPAPSPTAELTPGPTPEPSPDPSRVTGDTAVTALTKTLTADTTALYTVSNGAELTLENADLDQTVSAGGNGNGTILSAEGGRLTLSACTFSSGAAGITLITAEGGAVTAADSVFVCDGAGTAFIAAADSSVSLSGSALRLCGTDETAFRLIGGSLSLTDTTVSPVVDGEEPSAGQTGSGLRLSELNGASLTAAGCELTGNVCFSGTDGAVSLDRTALTGDLTASDEDAELRFELKNISEFTGAIPYTGIPSVSVSLDISSRISLTEESAVAGLTVEDGALENIAGNGFNLYYNGELEENAWLGSRTYPLTDGGALIPLI